MALVATGAMLDQRYPDIKSEMYRLRKRVFVDQLKWVDISGDEEFDRYDRSDTVYCLAFREGRLVGHQRLLPTTKPYMLGVDFCDLMWPVPSGDDIWEVSRYAVDMDRHSDRLSVMAEMFCALAEFSVTHGVREIVLVQDPRIDHLSHMSFGTPAEITKTIDYGQAKAHALIYRPSWQHCLENTRAHYDVKAPAIDHFALRDTQPHLVLAAAE